jgi:hypothetical protein
MNRQEIKYIIYCTAFAIIWFALALPWLIKTIDGNILGQFLIFDIGVVALLNIYFKSRSTGMGINLAKSIEYMLVVLAIAIYLPPYHVIPWTGAVSSGEGSLLGTASVDYFFAEIGMKYFHISGILVSVWVFLVVPILLLLLASRISKSSFVNRV